MVIEWTPLAIFQVACGVLFVACAPTVLLRWHREHREEPGMAWRMLAQVGLWASVPAATWPARTPVTDALVMASMLTALVGYSMAEWAQHQRGARPDPQALSR